MKISIKDFGPIKTFEYDLTKDIVVTFGDNNIGKSYAMQLVYLLIKNLKEYVGFNNSYYHYSYSSHLIYTSNEFDCIVEILNNFARSDAQNLDITQTINSFIVSDLSKKFIGNFMNSCENTFGNFKSILEKKPIITLEIDNLKLKISLAEKQPLDATIYSSSTFLKRASSNFHKSRNANGRLDIYYCDNIESPLSVIAETISKNILDISIVIYNLIGDVFFLPASRSGIYSGMSAFSSIVAELSKNKAMLTRKIELPGISEPISDYFLLLSNIKGKENDSLSRVYSEIEENILHGEVKFNRSRSTLVYTPVGMQHEYEMTEVSSMVSEISPIVAFLKYIVSSPTNAAKRNKMYKAKPIVFIEEPEAHLHPKNQIKLINLFSHLHNANIKIVVSSHSNYIFNKLNNLLLKGEINPNIYSAILLQAEEGGSVSYFMDIDELGVNDTNFVDVAQDLYNEREKLIMAWNEEQV